MSFLPASLPPPARALFFSVRSSDRPGASRHNVTLPTVISDQCLCGAEASRREPCANVSAVRAKTSAVGSSSRGGTSHAIKRDPRHHYVFESMPP